MRILNELCTKPDNLEHFPLLILLQVFSIVDDIDLLNLVENSTRFESIIKIVLNERYRKKYFRIDTTKFNLQRYKDFLQLFGREIKAIKVKDDRREDHWIATLLSKFAYTPINWVLGNPFRLESQQTDHIIDAFVDSLKHLESLVLSNYIQRIHCIVRDYGVKISKT